MLHPALASPGGLSQFCRYTFPSPAGGKACSLAPFSILLPSPHLSLPATHATVHPLSTCPSVFLPIPGCRGRGQNFPAPGRGSMS